MPKVLILNLGWEQRPLVDALVSRACDLYGVHDDSRTVPDAPWHDVLIAGMRDLDRIVGFADRVRPDAVISDECDYAGFAQALLAGRYGLPGPGLPAAHYSTNKYLQRQAAAAAGIPVPEFALCLSPHDAGRFARDVGWPIIIKPVDNRGSIGVTRVDGPDDIAGAYTLALTSSHSHLVLAERFVIGRHLTIDGYCRGDAGALTIAVGANRKFNGERGIVNEAIAYPADLPEAVDTDARALAARTADALQYRFGPFHGEFIIEAATGRLYLTEMSNRGGGVHISNIALPFLTDFDLVGRHIDDALGLDPAEEIPAARPDRAVLLRFIGDDRLVGRRLRAAHGVAGAAKTGPVLRVQVFVAPGETFGRVDNGAARHAIIITGGARSADLEALADAALARLELDVDPPIEPARRIHG